MSQIIQTVNKYFDTSIINWQSILDWYEQHLSRFTNTRTKRVTITAAISLAVIGHTIHRLLTPPKHLQHIPHISAIALMKNFIFKKTPSHIIMRDLSMPLVEKYGIYLRLDRSGWTIHCATPETVKQVFLKSDIFPKANMKKFSKTLNLKFIGTSNILLESGLEWKKHRMLANPAFHRSMPVRLFGELACQVYEIWDKKYPTDFVVDFSKAMENLTLEIIGKAGFDFEFNAIHDEHSEWKVVYDEVSAAVRNPLFLFFPILDTKFLWLFSDRQKKHKTLQKFLTMLESIIDKKRKNIKENIDNGIEEAEKDLLTLMIESEFRGEGVLTNEELLGDLAIFFVAGHDTTANSLSAAIYYLGKHQDIQEKVRKEVLSVLCPNGEEPREDILPSIEQTKEFIYLNQVMKETLRMNGSVVSLVSPRKTTKDTYLNNYYVPKDSLVSVNIYDLHHSSNVWDDPETFNPDRWGPGGEADQKAGSGMSWVPFSNGSRQCIGMNFSLIEQRVILSTLLRRYTWKLPEGSPHAERIITGNSLVMNIKDLNICFHKRF
ncbi:cytochrome P-450 cyp509A1 [Cunninghamella echinulata]|nr:cytochrome P-450 cyp509A1 [Cunninghamella echinulata]